MKYNKYSLFVFCRRQLRPVWDGGTLTWRRFLTYIEMFLELCVCEKCMFCPSADPLRASSPWFPRPRPTATTVYYMKHRKTKRNDVLKRFILKFQNGLKTLTGSPKGSLNRRNIYRKPVLPLIIIQVARRVLGKCRVIYGEKRISKIRLKILLNSLIR